LKRQGVDASFSLPPDFDDRFQKGQYTGALYGHGGSVNDPYHTLRLYQSVSVAVPGGHLVNFAPVEERGLQQDRRRRLRYRHEQQGQADGVVPQGHGDLDPRASRHPARAQLPPHPDEHDVLDELATEQNSYVNGAFWHLTYAMILWNLQPTQ